MSKQAAFCRCAAILLALSVGVPAFSQSQQDRELLMTRALERHHLRIKHLEDELLRLKEFRTDAEGDRRSLASGVSSLQGRFATLESKYDQLIAQQASMQSELNQVRTENAKRPQNQTTWSGSTPDRTTTSTRLANLSKSPSARTTVQRPDIGVPESLSDPFGAESDPFRSSSRYSDRAGYSDPFADASDPFGTASSDPFGVSTSDSFGTDSSLSRVVPDNAKAIEVTFLRLGHCGACELCDMENTVEVLCRSGKYKESLSEIERVSRTQPSNPCFSNARGIVYCKMGNTEAAISEFSNCIHAEPEVGTFYYNRYLALREAGKYERAYRDISKHYQLGSDIPGLTTYQKKQYKALAAQYERQADLYQALAQ